MSRRSATERLDASHPLTRRQFGLASLGALLTGGVVLSGCGGNDTSATAPASNAAPGANATAAGGKKTITYAVIPKMLNNPFFDIAHNGALKAKRDLEAADPSITINIEYQSSDTGDAAQQAEIIRRLIGRKVDGLAISVVDVNAVRDVIDQAVAQGIPTMCWDSDCPSSKRSTFYSVNDQKLGAELGTQLLLACGGKLQPGDEIALLSGQSSAPNLQNRVKGVMSVLDKSPGLKVLPTLFCDDKSEKAVEQIKTMTAAHPNLRGWVMVGGWPLFAKNALDGIRDRARTKVICTDALEQQWEYLESGQCEVLVAQRPFSYGEESIKILDNLRTKKKTDYPPVQEAAYDLVYKEPTSPQKAAAEKSGVKAWSLADYKKQWAEWNQKA
jgi:ribose transport system substrate-binding protein